MTAIGMRCPLPSCDWSLELLDQREKDSPFAPGVASALGVPIDALLSIREQQARHNAERDAEIHLRSHTPIEWATALAESQAARVREFTDYTRILRELQDAGFTVAKLPSTEASELADRFANDPEALAASQAPMRGEFGNCECTDPFTASLTGHGHACPEYSE